MYTPEGSTNLVALQIVNALSRRLSPRILTHWPVWRWTYMHKNSKLAIVLFMLSWCLSQRGAIRGHAKTLVVVDVETYDFAHFDWGWWFLMVVFGVEDGEEAGQESCWVDGGGEDERSWSGGVKRDVVGRTLGLFQGSSQNTYTPCTPIPIWSRRDREIHSNRHPFNFWGNYNCELRGTSRDTYVLKLVLRCY